MILRKIGIFFFLLVVMTIILGACQSKQPAYLDTSLSFEQRAADLVSRMTLEEKVSQMLHEAPAVERPGDS